MSGIEILLGVAAGLGGLSTIQAGRQQARAANAQSEMSRFRARQAEVEGIVEGTRIMREANRVEASNNARFGAAGIVLGDGGVGDQVNEAVRRDANFNLDITRGNATTRASAFNLQASQQAIAGRAARTAALGSAATGLFQAGVTAFG